MTAITEIEAEARPPHALLARPIFWTNTPRTIPKARMTSRKACALRSGRCAWACG